MKIPHKILVALGVTKNKYGNKRSSCLLKHDHDSRAEADYCNSLLADKYNKKIIDFKVQQRWEVAPGINHVVDFEVERWEIKGCVACHRIEVHDVKGFATDVWKMKYKLFVAKYPYIKYVIINRKEDNGRTSRKYSATAGR